MRSELDDYMDNNDVHDFLTLEVDETWNMTIHGEKLKLAAATVTLMSMGMAFEPESLA